MENKEYEQKLMLYILTHPCEDFPMDMSLEELNKKVEIFYDEYQKYIKEVEECQMI